MVKFAEGDYVWAADNGNLYLSKIIKATEAGKLRKYFIHFQGWGQKFDVWADECNLVAQKDEVGKKKLFDSLQGFAKPAKEKKKSSKQDSVAVESAEVNEADKLDRTSALMSSSPSALSSKRKIISDEDMMIAKKRRRELAEKDLIDEHCGLDGEYMGKILIPLNIKKHLVDEWNLIAGIEKRLVRLPRPIPATDIFNEFLDEKKSKLNSDVYAVYKDIFEGFQIYFDRALPFILLYRQEREQYEIISTMFSDKFIPSDFYGGEHLLRLFVRLQRLLSGVFIDAADLNQIIVKLTEFLKWLEKNKDRFVIIGDYVLSNEAIDELMAINVEEFNELKASKQILLTETESKKRKVKSKVVEEIILSPSTGRPQRPQAGKNRYFD